MVYRFSLPPASALALALPLAACGSPAEEADDPAAVADDVDIPATPVAAAPSSPPPMWTMRSACHAVAPGQHGLGPSLAGVFGAKAASKSDFVYPDAMEASVLTWNQTNLDRYLVDPRSVVPGTKMAYAGLKNDAQRQAIIDYMKTL